MLRLHRITALIALFPLFGCSNELPPLPDAGPNAEQGAPPPLDGPKGTEDGPVPDGGCPEGTCFTGVECATEMDVPCSKDPLMPQTAHLLAETQTAICNPQTGQWSVPLGFCPWECDATYCELDGECVQSLALPCDAGGSLPPDAHFLISEVEVSCQSSGEFGPPPRCEWVCNRGFMLDTTGNRCVVDPAGSIVIFDGGGHAGALGGRQGTTDRCQAAASSAGVNIGSDSKIVALISVDTQDEIRSLPLHHGVPSNQPVLSHKGIKIAESFDKMLGGSILEPLKAAGVIDAQFWYSGSTPQGAVTYNTCDGWTVSGSANVRADYGNTGESDSKWIQQSGTAICGNAQYHLLCLAYVP